MAFKSEIGYTPEKDFWNFADDLLQQYVERIFGRSS